MEPTAHSTSTNSPVVKRALGGHTKRSRTSSFTNSFRRNKGGDDEDGVPTKQECSKLVRSLSKDIAVYSCLSMGIGAMGDSFTLRDEIRAMGTKLFDSVQLCKRKLMPLLMSKRLKEDERSELERLYRIFSGCLELLQEEFVRVITLQTIFPLWDANNLLIQTGVSESMPFKKLCSSRDGQHDVSVQDRKSMEEDDFNNLEKKVTGLQELSYTTSQLMDVKPWDVRPDTDHTKIEVETSDAEVEDASNQPEASVHANTEGPRHRKCIWILVIVLGTAVVIAGVIGLAVALSDDDDSDN